MVQCIFFAAPEDLFFKETVTLPNDLFTGFHTKRANVIPTDFVSWSLKPGL